MSERKASDLFVECLEAEGVKYVFGIPGEETLDLNESLERSSVSFVPVRHEQGGAYMADMYGRLTQRAGVCLGTLGPGATNLITAVADAFLDHAPADHSGDGTQGLQGGAGAEARADPPRAARGRHGGHGRRRAAARPHDAAAARAERAGAAQGR